MITRLRTSKLAKERLQTLSAVLRFSNNGVILRYALSRSLSLEDDIYSDMDSLITDTAGFEITRSTLFGDKEIVYKLLMNAQDIEDEEFFPKLTNMHIERGLKLLERDYRMAGNKDKFILNYIRKLSD
jgi:DNA sulfur modification protein DndE